MSVSALDIYAAHLAFHLGADGHTTEPAIIDPSGEHEQTINGVYDDVASRGSKDSGNTARLVSNPRLVTADVLNSGHDVYAGVEVYLPHRSLTYKIQRVDPDANGASVIWLY